jgi:hypothetical protein
MTSWHQDETKQKTTGAKQKQEGKHRFNSLPPPLPKE